MSNHIAHFAINASDIDRAQRFYGAVFGWTFEPWGPPGFLQINTGSDLRGALQKRRDLVADRPIYGFECTIAVDDIQRTKAEIEEAGGRIVMQPATLAGVGHLIFFEDPEGNIAGAMEYDAGAE
jgi:hypothetical protein